MTKANWHWIQDGDFPKEEKEFYCVCKSSISNTLYSQLLDYCTDLYHLSKYDFEEYKGKKQNGFVLYDSEWGWIEMDNVLAWCELPELPNLLEYTKGENNNE